MVLDTETLILLSSVALLLVCSAFFSGSETSLMASSRPKLHKKEKEGSKAAARVNRLLDNVENLLSTILLGNNLVNIAASALTTGLFIKLFGDSGIAIATIIMTFLVLIFAEIVPKTVASRNPEKHALWIAVPMTFLMWALKPFTLFIRFFSGGILRLCGIKEAQNTFDEDDVRGAIGMGLEEGVLKKGEHRMLHSVFELDEITVEDIMVHRGSVMTMDGSLTIEKVYAELASKPVHTRLPIWKEKPENIIGILHVKDFYRAYHSFLTTKKKFKLTDILQKPYFIPMNVVASKQLLEFRRQRRHMALVVDEYGDLQGLITLEDILEEIVGEIEDEHDIPEEGFTKEKDGTYILDGTFPVRDANRELDLEFPTDDDAVTIAGMLTAHTGHIPRVGEEVKVGNYHLKVLQKKRQAILKVRLFTPKAPQKNKKSKEG